MGTLSGGPPSGGVLRRRRRKPGEHVRKPGRSGVGSAGQAGVRRARASEARSIVAAVKPRALRNWRKPETLESLRASIKTLLLEHPAGTLQVAPGIFEFRAVSRWCPGVSYWRFSVIMNNDRYRLIGEAQAEAFEAEGADVVRTRTSRGDDLAYLRQPGGSGEPDEFVTLVFGAQLHGGRAGAKVVLAELTDSGIWPGPQSGESPLCLLALKTIRACGKCAYCERKRKREAVAKITAEVVHSERLGGTTWWSTLTLNDDQQYQVRCRAEAAVAAAKIKRDGKLVVFDALSDAERFKALHAAALPEVQKFLKRLRTMLVDEAVRQGRPVKGVPLMRYVRAGEPHKSGKPHFHLLLHEQDPMFPLRNADLEAQWGRKVVGHRTDKFGKSVPIYERISHWRQASSDDRGCIGYLAKYIVKYGAYRCSELYGDPVEAAVAALKRSLEPPVVKVAAALDDVDHELPQESPEDVPVYDGSGVSVTVSPCSSSSVGDYHARQAAGFGDKRQRKAEALRLAMASRVE